MVLIDTSDADSAFVERWLAAEPMARKVARRYFRRGCDIDDVTQHMLSAFPVIDGRWHGRGDYDGFLYRSFRFQLLNWWRLECNRGMRGVPSGVRLGWVPPLVDDDESAIDRAYVGVRDCVQCGREFAPTADHVVVCSRECRTAIIQRRETIGIMASEMVAILDRLRQSMAERSAIESVMRAPAWTDRSVAGLRIRDYRDSWAFQFGLLSDR